MIDTWEWAEVAAHILGLPEETDEEVVERELLQEFGLDLEGFGNIADKLLGMTVPVETALGGSIVQAFVKFEDTHVRALATKDFKRD
ncbi:hypothetical protein PONTUS_125 [Vibrio phage Pontus]|uniref:Uncharacterized protein n=1 Tax=Vibrio phage Pontus TaxID=2590874 RepID=A0A4Y6E8D7_9CAUD|nr:hypothetical protein KNU59_gp174 [Vibrio phage Pontus]QDF14754.1 hypothetical protein PONTUS_125 [Vibrio phage Pontus]